MVGSGEWKKGIEVALSSQLPPQVTGVGACSGTLRTRVKLCPQNHLVCSKGCWVVTSPPQSFVKRYPQGCDFACTSGFLGVRRSNTNNWESLGQRNGHCSALRSKGHRDEVRIHTAFGTALVPLRSTHVLFQVPVSGYSRWWPIPISKRKKGGLVKEALIGQALSLTTTAGSYDPLSLP